MFADVLKMGDEFVRDMKAVLLRMSLQQNQCIVSQTRELMLDMDVDDEDDGKGMLGAMAGMGRRIMGFGGPGGGGGGGGRRQPRRPR